MQKIKYVPANIVVIDKSWNLTERVYASRERDELLRKATRKMKKITRTVCQMWE